MPCLGRMKPPAFMRELNPQRNIEGIARKAPLCSGNPGRYKVWLASANPSRINLVSITMGSITLITGGVRSGKSAFALGLAGKGPPSLRRFLVATAEALDDEMRERIARHRGARPSNFETVEEPVALSNALARLDGRADVVVIDCITLWLSNLMMAGRGDEAVLAEGRALAEMLTAMRFESLLVSGEVGSGIVPENAAARRFADLLGWTNQTLARAAERVILMVAGCPMRVK